MKIKLSNLRKIISNSLTEVVSIQTTITKDTDYDPRFPGHEVPMMPTKNAGYEWANWIRVNKDNDKAPGKIGYFYAAWIPPHLIPANYAMPTAKETPEQLRKEWIGMKNMGKKPGTKDQIFRPKAKLIEIYKQLKNTRAYAYGTQSLPFAPVIQHLNLDARIEDAISADKIKPSNAVLMFPPRWSIMFDIAIKLSKIYFKKLKEGSLKTETAKYNGFKNKADMKKAIDEFLTTVPASYEDKIS
jgi:hypothetical protein